MHSGSLGRHTTAMPRHEALLPNHNSSVESLKEKLYSKLTELGFFVTIQQTGTLSLDSSTRISDYTDHFDMVFYAFDYKPAPSLTSLRVNWKNEKGEIVVPWFVQEIPTIAVSFGNPYHFSDMPYINAYNDNNATIDALCKKLTGQSLFTGNSPTDISGLTMR